MSDELKERNILKLILIVRFACATLDVGHPRDCPNFRTSTEDKAQNMMEENQCLAAGVELLLDTNTNTNSN
jgi:hypothetical protein